MLEVVSDVGYLSHVEPISTTSPVNIKLESKIKWQTRRLLTLVLIYIFIDMTSNNKEESKVAASFRAVLDKYREDQSKDEVSI